MNRTFVAIGCAIVVSLLALAPVIADCTLVPTHDLRECCAAAAQTQFESSMAGCNGPEGASVGCADDARSDEMHNYLDCLLGPRIVLMSSGLYAAGNGSFSTATLFLANPGQTPRPTTLTVQNGVFGQRVDTGQVILNGIKMLDVTAALGDLDLPVMLQPGQNVVQVRSRSGTPGTLVVYQAPRP